MSSALLCADLALDNPFVFVPQEKPDLLRKRLPNLSKLAGVTLGSRLEIRGAPEIVLCTWSIALVVCVAQSLAEGIRLRATSVRWLLVAALTAA